MEHCPFIIHLTVAVAVGIWIVVDAVTAANLIRYRTGLARCYMMFVLRGLDVSRT